MVFMFSEQMNWYFKVFFFQIIMKTFGGPWNMVRCLFLIELPLLLFRTCLVWLSTMLEESSIAKQI